MWDTVLTSETEDDYRGASREFVSLIKEVDIPFTVLSPLCPAWNVDVMSGAVATLCEHEGSQA